MLKYVQTEIKYLVTGEEETGEEWNESLPGVFWGEMLKWGFVVYVAVRLIAQLW